MTEQPTAAATPTHHSHRDTTTISEYLESLLVTVILALFGTSFVVQAFKIPSPSMEKTLLVGDHLLVNKFVFGGTGSWYEKFLPYRMLSRNGPMTFGNMCGGTNLSFHPTGISRWATIAITVLIAATGALWIAARSWAAPF